MTFLEAREFAKRNHMDERVLQLLDAVERGVNESRGPQGELTYTLNLPDGSIYQDAVAMDTERDAVKAAKVIEHIKSHVNKHIDRELAALRAVPQAPRVLELARIGAIKQHDDAIRYGSDNHTRPILDCPHPDCALVRAGGAQEPAQPEPMNLRIFEHEGEFYLRGLGYSGHGKTPEAAMRDLVRHRNSHEESKWPVELVAGGAVPPPAPHQK